MNHDRVQSVFEEVFDLSAADREDKVASLCAGEPEVRAAVLSLLQDAAAAEASPFLRTPLLGDHLFVASDSRAQSPQPQIPKYEIRESIGHGSTSDVYRACSVGPLPREVAIKVLHSDLPDSVVSRFYREQKLLASLNLPGVAQVYDAGTTNDGREFVVVELIDGPPLTRFASQAGLSWRDRVRLMVRACQAVQAIHANGVLHRDLKPANILVRKEPEGVAVKVVDFGAATHVRPELALTSQLPHFVGTIAYMAPEQLEHGDRATIGTDVYALGLILHELLSEHHPFSADALGLGELVHRITTTDPEPLPASLGGDRSDLEAIIAKACAKDPAARYATAQHLADDLLCVLEHRPIRARSPSTAAQLRSLVRRHPRTMMGLTLSIGLIIGLAAQLALASARNVRLSHQTQDTFDLLVDDVLQQLGELDGAHQMRSALAADLLRRLDSLPGPTNAHREELRARVLDCLSDSAYARGDMQASGKLRDQVIEILGLLQADDPTNWELRSLLTTASIKRGDVHNQLGERDEARQLYQAAHQTIERSLALRPSDESLIDDLTWSYERLIPFELPDHIDRARSLAERRLALSQDLFDRSPENALRQFGLGCAFKWCASLFYRVQQYEDALPHAQRAVTLLDAAVANEPQRFWFRSRQVEAHVELFRLLALLGDQGFEAEFSIALEIAESYVTANPGALLPLQQLAFVLRNGLELHQTTVDEEVLNHLRIRLEDVTHSINQLSHGESVRMRPFDPARP